MIKLLLAVVAATALIITAGCGGDNSTDSRKDYSELIVGGWEAEYSVDNGEVEYADDDDLYWFFLADGSFRDLENNHDGTYDVDCPAGMYTITQDTLTVTCRPSSWISVGYEFTANGDTLRLMIDDDEYTDEAVFSSAPDAPDWRDWMPSQD